MAHSTGFRGHMRRTKITSWLLMQCYWPLINTDIENMHKASKEFQLTRLEGRFPKAFLRVTDTQSKPFEKINSMDTVGPL